MLYICKLPSLKLCLCIYPQFILIALFFLLSQPAYSIDEKKIPIRIFQLIHLKNLIFKNPQSPFQIIIQKSDNKDVELSSVKYLRLRILPDNSVILTSGYRDLFKGSIKSLRVKPLSEKAILAGNHIIPPRPYSGSFYVYLDQEEWISLNYVRFDQYLMSVVNAEMWGVGNSAASLKAQTVVSRSFAGHQLKHQRHKGLYLCDTTHCQVYLGAKKLNSIIKKAVLETQNQILSYKKERVAAYYHSTCGGRTSTPKEVWGHKGNHYLIGIKDTAKNGQAYCYQSPHYSWQCQIKKINLYGIFFNSRTEYPGSLMISDWLTGKSKRTLSFRLNSAERSRLISGEQFRIYIGRSLGWNKIKSSYITDLRDSGHALRFQGKGLGHGIGLCQYGAARMGDIGISYQAILKHYFPKCTLLIEGIFI